MKKLIYSLCLICLGTYVYSQTKETLLAIANVLESFDTYQSHCYYTHTTPFGELGFFECDMVLKLIPEDTLSGFYYCFNTDENYLEGYGEFTAYFDNTIFRSYKQKVEKIEFSKNPEKFVDIKSGKNSFVPSIQTSHILYSHTPYKMVDEIYKILEDEDTQVFQLEDTIINNQQCSHFKVITVKKNQNPVSSSELIDITTTRSFYFDKESYYPVYYKSSLRSSYMDQEIIVLFMDTKINQIIAFDFFTEGNIWPNEMKDTNYNEEIKKASDLVGKVAPDWELPILGEDYLLANKDLQGKYVVLDFTATWCIHCVDAAKLMNRLEEKYKDNPYVSIVSLFSSSRDNHDAVSKFSQKYNLKSTILYSATEVGDLYNVYGYPCFFIVSPKGKIISCFNGFDNAVESNIISMLSEFIE